MGDYARFELSWRFWTSCVCHPWAFGEQFPNLAQKRIARPLLCPPLRILYAHHVLVEPYYWRHGISSRTWYSSLDLRSVRVSPGQQHRPLPVAAVHRVVLPWVGFMWCENKRCIDVTRPLFFANESDADLQELREIM